MLRFRLREFGLLVLSSLVAVAAAGQPAPLATVDAYIKGGAAQAEMAAQLGAKVVSRSSSTGLIRLRIPAGRKEAFGARALRSGLPVERWEQSPAGPGDLGSAANLAASVTAMRKSRAEFGKTSAPGYMEYQKEWLRLRAFPYDRIDLTAAAKAREHMDAMKGYRAGGPDSQTLALERWQYVGANDLPSPSTRIYYGLGRLSGRVNAIAYDPSSPQTIYAGSARGGLWKSTDNGVNWTHLSALWPSQNVNTVVTVTSSLIYVGLGDLHGSSPYGAGIMKSTDGGASWQQLGTSAFGASVGVSGIVVIPYTNGNTLVACTGGPGRGNIFRSIDGGATWTKTHGIAHLTWTGLSMSPFALDFAGNRLIYAVSSGVGPWRLWRSKDSGKTWQGLAITSSLSVSTDMWHFAAAASQVELGTVYFQANKMGKVFKSTDFGATWKDISAGMPDAVGRDGGSYNFSQWSYNYHLTVSKARLLVSAFPPVYKDFDVLYAGNIDLLAYCEGWGGWVSAGGPTYTYSAITHNDQHSMAVHPTNSNTVLVGNDGGIYRMTVDPSKPVPQRFAYESLNSKLSTHLYVHFDVDPATGRVVAGAQDNGFQAFDTSTWRVPMGGDGMYGHIHPTNSAIQIGSTQNLSLYYTSNAWTTRAFFGPTIPDDQVTPFVGRTEWDANNVDYLYAGTNYVHTYRFSTGKWTQTTSGLVPKPDYVTAFASHKASALLAAATSNGWIFTSTDRGKTWTSRKGGLADLAITSISINPNNADDALITMGGTSGWQVMRTVNFLAAAPVWTTVVGSGATALPNITANTVVRSPSSPSTTWWVGNDFGVFITQDAGATWLNATTSLGLPSVEVTRLKFGPTGWLYASTYGRGIWKFRTGEKLLKSITFAPATGKRGDSSYATVAFNQPALEDMRVSITGSGISGVTHPLSLNIKKGAVSFGFLVNLKSAVSIGPYRIVVAEPGGSTVAANLPVENPTVASVSISPSTVKAPETATATVTLDSPAVPGGQVFPISGGNAFVIVPASVTVPGGQKSATFTISTLTPSADTSRLITVGGKSAAFNLLRPRLKNLYLDKLQVVGGHSSPINGRIEMDSNAGPGGISIALSADLTGLAYSTPITIPQGQRFSSWFTVSAAPVTSSKYIKLTAAQRSASGALEASDAETVTVLPNGVKSFTLAAQSVLGGRSVQGTVELFEPAPSYGFTVPLSENSNFVVPPANLYFPNGVKKLTFTISTLLPPMDQTVPITAGGVTGQTASLKVLWNGVVSAVATPSTVTNKTYSTVTVTLAAPAPATGAVCTISIPAAWPLVGPTSVTVPTGQKKATFQVTGKIVSSPFLCKVPVSYKSVSAEASITVNP